MPQTLYTRSRIWRKTGSIAAALGEENGVAETIWWVVISLDAPGRRDRLLWKHFSGLGSVRPAVRFPGLIDSGDRPRQPAQRRAPALACPTLRKKLRLE